MADISSLQAEVRERVGKGSARATRREGRVPAVVYGLGQAPTTISLAFNHVLKEVNTGRFANTIYDLQIGKDTERVIPRDVQYDVVNDFPIHVDFLRISRDTKVAVNVAVHFANEDDAPGLKRGGVLNIVRHEVELSCPADSIPEEIVIDLAGLDIGDSVHISSVSLPEGVESTITDRDFTIATIAAPSGGADDEEEVVDGEEGEGAEGEEAAAEEDAEAEDDGPGLSAYGQVAEEYKETRAKHPAFGPGDTINVHYKIREGNKERIQQFQGVVISKKGEGSRKTFTVRKISNGIGVERVFPLHSPKIAKIERVRRGIVRRAKLYYLRNLRGKAARIKENMARR